MSEQEISVLICDDSALMRNILGKIVEKADGLRLAGKAMNGRFALDKIPKLNPDILLLDLEMPEINGIEFLKIRREKGIEIPVVILSSLAQKGARITMEALSLGASDFILKPSGTGTSDYQQVEQHIIETLRAYGSQYRKDQGKPLDKRSIPVDERPKPPVREAASAAEKAPAPPKAQRKSVTDKIELVAIGISTGGPNALREVFAGIDPELPVPVVVVQHMPAGFTEEFARSLDRISPLQVKEAADGDILTPGRVLIAPGHGHLRIEKRKLATVARISDADPVNGHRPSVDVLFKSVAQEIGEKVLAVIMTGMGKDGAREMGSLYKKGAITLGQNASSCIVYGMPRAAYEMGFVDQQVPLNEMADTINRLVREKQ